MEAFSKYVDGTECPRLISCDGNMEPDVPLKGNVGSKLWSGGASVQRKGSDVLR